MAVSANENGIKILGNPDGVRLLRTFENLSYDASRTSEVVTKVIFQMMNSFGTYSFFYHAWLTFELFQPAMNPISVAAAAATSAGLADRNASAVAISGMVRWIYLFFCINSTIMILLHMHFNLQLPSGGPIFCVVL